MATIRRHKARGGAVTFTATVRIKPFPPACKTLPNRKDVEAWARELERELRKQRDRGGLRRDVPKMTVAQLITEYLEDPETKGKRYFDSLSLLLAWWVGHYGSTKVMELNVLQLREARATLKTGRAPATANRYLSAMRSAWNWGRAAGLVPQEQSWPSRLMLTEPKGRVRYLSDGELASLLEAAGTLSATMRAAILLSVGCGIRQSELRRLRWADVDLDGQRIRVLLTKNNESRSVYLPASAADALRALKRGPVVGQTVIADDQGQPVDKDWLAYRWRIVRTAAGLSDFHWHDMRHSCASFLAQQGATLLEIGSVLGHRSPAVTQRYAHLVQGAPVTGHAALDSKLRGGK
ncbi:MAG: site-specific integrase [Pseudomonadota bacterium]|jgi:integrase|nr:site-specific integrase [Pseudomonadota bacterium]